MITIRKATSKDVEYVQALNQELFNHDSQFDDTLDLKWPSKNKKYYSDMIKSKKALVLVVEDEKEIVGYLIGSMSEPENFRNIKKIAELDNMIISAKYRGQGIGTQLIQKFTQWVKDNKVHRVRVVASALNERTVNAYLKNGFRPYNNVMEMNL